MDGFGRMVGVGQDAVELVDDILSGLGLTVGRPRDLTAGDLVVNWDSATITLQIKPRSLVDDDVARAMLRTTTPEATLLVVADRVTEKARRLLLAERAGFLDLRGRLGIRTEALWIELDIPSINEGTARANALSGKAGMEVAAALLMEPERVFGIRELARELHRSPSTISEILAALRSEDLVDGQNRTAGTDLFWQLADHWPTKRVAIARLPEPNDPITANALRFGMEDLSGPGWALTDSHAAVAYGAPLALRSDQALDFFVPDSSTIRRATSLLGASTSPAATKATLRLAPTPSATQPRVGPSRNTAAWGLTHPLFVALDLAQDLGRGREVLAEWTPDKRWTRVW